MAIQLAAPVETFTDYSNHSRGRLRISSMQYVHQLRGGAGSSNNQQSSPRSGTRRHRRIERIRL